MSERKTDYLMDATSTQIVAGALLGAPRPDLSVDDELWFGADGMIELNQATGAWRDHGSNKEGTDVVDLVRWVMRLSRDAAVQWIGQNCPSIGVADLQPAQPGAIVAPVIIAGPVQSSAEIEIYLPDDLARERDLLGILLADQNLVDVVLEDIGPADFTSVPHANLFQMLLAQRANGEAITIAGIISALTDGGAGDVEMFGITAGRYVAHLIAAAPLDGQPDHAWLRDMARAIAESTRVDMDGGEILPEPTPQAYRYRYGPIRWQDLDSKAKRAYSWLVKNIVPLGASILIIGRSGSGKSFMTFDMAMHVARGIDYYGRKVKPMGVVLLCYEGGSGVDKRMRAYAQANDVPLTAIPFVALTRPPNVYASEENVDHLVTEILEVSKTWPVPLGVIIIDTHNSATRGSSEIKSEDVSLIMSRYETLREKTSAGLWIIGHTNTEGRHRGNEQVANGIETMLRVEIVEAKGMGELRDDDGRKRHRVVVDKQREGEDKIEWEFVLPQITIGHDEDGDPITSCVAWPPNRVVDVSQRDDVKHQADTSSGNAFKLRDHEVLFFRALLKALGDGGMATPVSLNLPPSVGRVVTYSELATAYRALVPNDEGTDEKSMTRYREKIKQRLRRSRGALQNFHIIGIEQLKDGEHEFHVIWPTGRPVVGAGLSWPSVGRMAALKDAEPPIDDANMPAGDGAKW